MLFKDMVGRVVVEVRKQGDTVVLLTVPERGSKEEPVETTFSAEGDCCSSGWLGAVKVPDLPAKITKCPDSYSGESDGSVEDLLEVGSGLCPRSYPPNGQTGDYLAQWLYTIETDCGPIAFDVWNDSNGYYGSNVEIR